MTTVNAPVCLLARNEFYRSICPTDKMKTVESLSDNLMEPKQRQLTVWVTKSKHQDFSKPLSNGWTINVVLRNPTSSGNSPKRPADRVVKQTPAKKLLRAGKTVLCFKRTFEYAALVIHTICFKLVLLAPLSGDLKALFAIMTLFVCYSLCTTVQTFGVIK